MNDVVTNGMTLRFHVDPAEFLVAAGSYLAAEPVISTVVATNAQRSSALREDGIAQPDNHWWLVVTDAVGLVVGVGMQTAPFAPYPAFLLPMPEDAAVALAAALHERHEDVRAVNGALPAVETFAAEFCRLGGGRVEVAEHTRLHELHDLIWPEPVSGSLRIATEDDLDLAMDWFGAFAGDADVQAGRPRGSGPHEAPDADGLLRRIRDELLWFWIDETGEPVNLTGANATSFGVARVGPVYTPPEQRGRGWASNAVAAVSARLQASGARVCLFTDQANPTSNKVYAALGYHPVADMANLIIVR